MDDNVLCVEHVSLGYGSRLIVDDLSFCVPSGSVLGVVGPNGAGKSTLIKGLSGVLRPWCGRISLLTPKRSAAVDMRRLTRAELARTMAVVPQNPTLPESFTAVEIVQMGRTPHLGFLQGETPRDWAAIWRAMELSDSLGIAERRIGELSGGERQRVVIARALAQEPSVLLLDEPTAHLDLAHQIAVLDLVSRLHGECRLTVVAVFHDLNLAAQYCHRLIMLADGRIRVDGTPREVITSDNIRQVYGASVDVLPNPHNGLPMTVTTYQGQCTRAAKLANQ